MTAPNLKPPKLRLKQIRQKLSWVIDRRAWDYAAKAHGVGLNGLLTEKGNIAYNGYMAGYASCRRQRKRDEKRFGGIA